MSGAFEIDMFIISGWPIRHRLEKEFEKTYMMHMG
jgi:hypothetical protein